ncbi:MAG: PIG-L family deacetylase [Christensenella sp.]|nr:PIG-L family deacetylase [Christensenella sp.]
MNLALWNPKAKIFVPDGKKQEDALARTTVLCVSAHQDDTEIMAYHAIGACYGKEDEWFTSVIATDGAGSPRSGIYSGYTDQQMQEVRAKEQNHAAEVGGYAAQLQLGYTSAQVKDAFIHDLTDDLVKIITACRPEIVVTHNLADRHETHVSTALRTLQALRKLAPELRPQKVYSMEVWRNLDWLDDTDKIVFDTSMHPNIARAVLGVFDSQICGGKRYDLAAEGRRRANATFLASHGVDQVEEASYGFDITQLMDEKNDPAEYMMELLNRFNHDVMKKIKNHW